MADVFDISTSGMLAQRTRLNVISNNLANVETAHNVDGERVPYRRKEVRFAPKLESEMGSSEPAGVEVRDIQGDPSPFRQEYKPGHPAANKDGYVKMPNVHPVVEMTDMMMASRAYEANATAFQTAESMHSTSLRILA